MKIKKNSSKGKSSVRTQKNSKRCAYCVHVYKTEQHKIVFAVLNCTRIYKKKTDEYNLLSWFFFGCWSFVYVFRGAVSRFSFYPLHQFHVTRQMLDSFLCIYIFWNIRRSYLHVLWPRTKKKQQHLPYSIFFSFFLVCIACCCKINRCRKRWSFLFVRREINSAIFNAPTVSDRLL